MCDSCNCDEPTYVVMLQKDGVLVCEMCASRSYKNKYKSKNPKIKEPYR